MIARGRVQNGVVVLDAGVQLPEGQEVTVLVAAGVGLRGIEWSEAERDGNEAGAAVIQVPRHEGSSDHSLLDIEPARLGAVLRPLTTDDDLLDEMLDGRW